MKDIYLRPTAVTTVRCLPSVPLIVSFPLINMQLEPPPSKFIASTHPKDFKIFATSAVVYPTTPGVISRPSQTNKMSLLSLVIHIAERG